MNQIVKNSFKELLTDGVSAYEHFLTRRGWPNPTDGDGKIRPKVGRHILEDSSDRVANKALRDLFNGVPVSEFSQQVRDAFEYLRWIDQHGLTHDGWRKALSMLPLADQCAALDIPIERIEVIGGNTDIERSVARTMAPSDSVVFYRPYRILIMLYVISTSALVEYLLQNPNLSDKISQIAHDRSALALEVDTLNNFRGRVNEEVETIAARLHISVTDVWQISEEIRELQLDTMEDLFTSWSRFIWHFENNHLSLATSVLGDEDEARAELGALWDAIGGDGMRRICQALFEDEIRELGWPDLTFCLPGTLHCWEVKKARDRLSYSQIRQIVALQEGFPDLIPVIGVAYAEG